MKITHLILREIRHRKLNFFLSLLGVMAAVALSCGVLTLLRAHDLRSAHLLDQKKLALEQTTQELDDEMRKIAKRMGFNVMILPKDQNLAELYSTNVTSKYMPESYATRLANSKIVTIRHLLPIIEQRVRWPERQGRTVFLIGIRRQVPVAHKAPKKPIQQPVKEGEIIVGAELARTEEIKVGQEVLFMGKKLKVSKVHGERGTKDDLSVYVNLDIVQDLLEKPSQINAIKALECKCAWADLPKIRQELATLLPETQVIEFKTKALARAEMRQAAVNKAAELYEQEEQSRTQLLSQNQTLASVLVPIDILVAGIWVGLLALANVRERRNEIGILRALGIRSGQVMGVFLTRAMLIGGLGALVGFAMGFGGGVAAAGFASPIEGLSLGATQLFSPTVPALLLALTPLLAAAATWLPALSASQQDPAEVLREE